MINIDEGLSHKFGIAFLNAFYTNNRKIYWSNDRVLKTNVMRSYIYQSIADFMDLSLMCEHPADAAYYTHTDCSNLNGSGCPNPKQAVILLEHEINSEKSHKELKDLVKWEADLRVLITYRNGTIKNQIKWLSDKFKNELDTKPDLKLVFVLSNTSAQSDDSNTYYTPPELYWSFYCVKSGEICPLIIDLKYALIP